MAEAGLAARSAEQRHACLEDRDDVGSLPLDNPVLPRTRDTSGVEGLTPRGLRRVGCVPALAEELPDRQVFGHRADLP